MASRSCQRTKRNETKAVLYPSTVFFCVFCFVGFFLSFFLSLFLFVVMLSLFVLLASFFLSV